jgi:hypothetical protein
VRNKQFGQLQSDLRAELGRNNDPGVRAADLPQIQQVLRRNYESLYDAYDWPHLNEIHDRIAMAAGQRFYDFPDSLDYDKITAAVVWYNGQPVPLERGIGFAQYAVYDSEGGDRSNPVQRWDVRYVAGVAQLEAWPIPASNTVDIQFEGKRKFVPLVDDANPCLLDDQIVTLSAAAEIAKDDNDIKLKLRAAQDRLGVLKGRGKGASTPVRLGLGSEPKPFGIVLHVAGA